MQRVTVAACVAAAATTAAAQPAGPPLELFWIQAKQARPGASAPQVAQAEKRLGVRLPPTYVALMTRQNGGYTRYGGVRDPASGGVTSYVLNESLLPLEELRTLEDVAGDVDFGDTPDWRRSINARHWIMLSRHGGDWFLCLDYSRVGPQGEPAVVSLDTSGVPRERFRASSFDAFSTRLVYDGAAAGTGHHYAIEAPLSEEQALVKAFERSFSIKLTSGPDRYSWFEVDRVWTPEPRSWRPFFQLQQNRDRRGVLQLPERPQAAWILRVVDLPLAAQSAFEGQLKGIPFPVTLVHRPPPRD